MSLDAETSSHHEVRKTVSILFCDVTGSTSLGERLDPETVRRVMGRYFDEMRSVLEFHGGSVEKFIGDAIMAVFGVPLVHEDDALRAVRAATTMRERLSMLNKELERDHGVSIDVRIGVNTGEVVAGTSAQTLATGDAVNVAARLEQAASTGEILIGVDTFRLVRDAVAVESVEPLTAKGKAERIRAFRLLSAEGAEGMVRRFDVPMIGRANELLTMKQALDRAERRRGCEVLTVIGPAGVGKSRLVREFLADEPTAGVVSGHCLSYGDGITYWPVVEMVTTTAGIEESDGPEEVRAKIAGQLTGVRDAELIVERLAHLLGVSGAEAAGTETEWAVRRLLEAIAASGPVVAVFEDLHWAEPALLDLIDHVAQWSREPILVLCTARRELLDQRPGWPNGRRIGRAQLSLEALSEDECDQLVSNLLDREELPAGIRRAITATSEGNPLFVEHMVAMLIDDGLLRRDGNRRQIDEHTQIRTPTSIMALLEARLERLSPPERAVIERASIEGRRFHAGWIRALDPTDDDPMRLLHSLERRDLIRRDRSPLIGEEGFRFAHALVRDAAYRRVSKRSRADLHERFVDWFEGIVGDRWSEFDEIVGFHLEQAYRLRSELGPLSDAAGILALRASKHLVSSGRRAADRGDARAASGLMSRAAKLLPVDHPDRVRLLVDLSVQLTSIGDLERAGSAIEEARTALGSMPDLSAEMGVRYARLMLDAAIEPEGVPDRMERVAREALPQLESTGDDQGLAQAWFLIGEAELFFANNAGMLDAFGRALHHAERAGDATVASHSAVWCAISIASGMTPAAEGLRSLDAIERTARGSLNLGAWLKITRGRCLAMLGEVERGRALAREGRAALLELGQALIFGSSVMETAPIDEMAGDIEAAERLLREGYDQLVALGDKGYLSTAAGRLARCVALIGDLGGAERLARSCRETSASDDIYSQAAWRQALALSLARRERPQHALPLAHEAVALAESSDDVLLRGTAYEDLADVLRLAGRPDAAVQALGRAIEVWKRKGATFVVERLQDRLANLRAP